MSSFADDDTIALVVSSGELEGETKLEDNEGEGDGVKMMDEGRMVVWTAATESLVGRESENRREGIGELLIRVVSSTMGGRGGGEVGEVSSDGGVVWEARGEGEVVASTKNDDVMSNTLGSSGSPLPLPVIPALGGEG